MEKFDWSNIKSKNNGTKRKLKKENRSPNITAFTTDVKSSHIKKKAFIFVLFF